MNEQLQTPAPASRTLQRNRELVERIEKSELFRDYRAAFETATGLPLAIRARGSFQKPLSGSKKTNAFCALMGARNRTCAACLDLQQRAEQEACDQSKTLECFAGLNDTVVPIRVGDSVVAYLQTGQVIFRAPTEQMFEATVRQLEQWGLLGDVAELKLAYFQTRVISRPNYEAAVRLLGSFSAHIALLSNELAVSEAAAEPIAVSKARAFIAEHLDEELSLTAVAQAASMSAFYFCKVFKATTGVTFTDYVARARIEKTKQMLLNPNVRVSEAAFAAGFQSLSQFNRVFRRIVGEAPTDYREQLRGGASRGVLAFAA